MRLRKYYYGEGVPRTMPTWSTAHRKREDVVAHGLFVSVDLLDRQVNWKALRDDMSHEVELAPWLLLSPGGSRIVRGLSWESGVQVPALLVGNKIGGVLVTFLDVW